MGNDTGFIGAGVMIITGIIVSIITTVILDEMNCKAELERQKKQSIEKQSIEKESSKKYYDDAGNEISEEVYKYLNS